MSGGGARVPIPAGTRKMVQDLKEIASNHSEDEIYAMLEECSFDPNETAQKLLLQDHFHEVKRKRDKRKEVVREPADPRRRPGGQGRGGRGGRGNISSRYVSHDVGARNENSGKENEVNQRLEKTIISFPSTTADTGSVPGIANGPKNAASPTAQVSDDNSMASREENSAETSKLGTVKITHNDVKSISASGQSLPTPNNISSTKSSSSVLGVHASTSDPMIVPSLDIQNLGEVGTIKRVVGSQRTVTEMSHKLKSKGPDTILDAPQVAFSSSFTGLAGSRPSSNYNNRSQHLSGSQKVVPNKEWKPKTTHAKPAQPSEMPDTSDVPLTEEAVGQSLAMEHSMSPEETTSKLEIRLDELHLERHHVIIPKDLQVPESETHGLSFGSFDVGFKLNMDFENGPVSDKSPTPPSEPCQDIEENVEQTSSSINTEPTAVPEKEYADHLTLPTQMTENYSSTEAGVSSIRAPQEYEQAKQEPNIAQDGPSVVQTTSSSTFGLIPQMLGSQFAQFESSGTQTRDDTRIHSFMAQPPFDPSTAYYNQFYRPTVDADSRFSPFLAPGGGSAKYNRSIGILSPQSGQAPQESGNLVVLSTAGSTPTTQAAGVVQSSLAVPQQPIPFFRQHAGPHISHYPPNYIPYNQYIPPFYVPNPVLHNFLNNAAFPQQHPAGSVYPPPGAAATATPVKYSLSQYKPGINNGNSALVGMPTNYGTYNSNPAGYTSSTSVASGNSNGNEDLGTTQFKENNVYITGHQSDGSAVWIPAPGRDMPSLQASSFFGISPQGQHMTFAPQVGHGAFNGMYHPTPAVAAAAVHPLLQQSQTVAGAVEMVGSPAGVYQQPQHGQMNWSSNY